jgi:PAS domain-containing protein
MEPAAERIFGWLPEEVIGRQIPFISPERFDEFQGGFHGKVDTGSPASGRRRSAALARVELL